MNTLGLGRGQLTTIGLLAALGALTSGCSSKSAAAEPLSKAASDDEPLPQVPSPAADGPRLFVLKDAPILERPSSSGRVVGELRAGATVARSVEPYSRKGCDGGWYVVRPKGFVCAGTAASPTPTPAHLALSPDLSRALPYRYGRARSEAVPVYARVPTAAEQLALEPDLQRHQTKREAEEQELLGAASNDVPLDARGVAAGPPVIQPGGEGVDPTSKRTSGMFFTFAPDQPPPPMLRIAQPGDVKVGVLRKGSGVALTTSFLADGGAGPRRFGLTADGHLVPTDRLRPALGSTWHGIDLATIGLPIAFVHKRGVHTWHLSRGKATKEDEELERRAPIAMSGKFRTIESVRFDETRDGDWIRAQDLVPVVKRTKLPDFAKGTQKWLDVSVANQTLTAYEGTKPVYATLVSTGRDQLGDPATAASTARGVFRVKAKAVARPIDSKEVHDGFDVADAPWALELDQGTKVTGAYWADSFGETSTFHDVVMAPIDARRIWSWSDPELPEGWSSVADLGGDTTIVNIRP